MLDPEDAHNRIEELEDGYIILVKALIEVFPELRDRLAEGLGDIEYGG